MNIVITIPAYNEAKTIGKVLKEINQEMDKSKYSYKLLLVDDGSQDKTADIAKKEGAIIVKHPRNYGLAETFRTEMKKCLELKPDIIVHTDADGQYLASEIPKLIKVIEKKEADLAMGSRFRGRIESMPIIKRLGNKAFSKVISNITKTKISDAQTGFRAFTKEVAAMPIQSDHTYTQEQIIRAVKSKFKVKEIPIMFKKRKSGKSKLMKSPFEYAVRAWINLLRLERDYNPLKFFGLFGGIFLSLSLIIGIWFVYLHFTTGITGHLGMLILMLLLFMTGIQISAFAFLADMSRIKK